MFSIPGVIALAVFFVLRPQDFSETLAKLPLLYLLLALALGGVALDLRLKRIRLPALPQLPFAIALYGWALISVAVRNRSAMGTTLVEAAVPVLLYFVVATGVQTFRAIETVAATLLGFSIFLCAVGLHQRTQPLECIRMTTGVKDRGVPDGRSCDNEKECLYSERAEPGIDYHCERPGLLGTYTVDGRVRYLGTLQDPNELALVVCAIMPFAFAFAERKRSVLRKVLLVIVVVTVALTTILTQSRGGQLVFLAVCGAYFLKRFGWRGALVGAILAAPILLLGGRAGAEASESSTRRLECWYEALQMFREWPILGVGQGQFTDHHYLTAHNAYLLVLAELGLPGMLLWSAFVYVGVKIALGALRRYGGIAETAPAGTWAMALVASVCGVLVGIFFLSFTYHPILGLWMGLCGALYAAAQRHDPAWKVRFGWRDLGIVAGLDVGIIGAVYLYTRLKGV